MATLEFISAEFEGQTFELPEGKTTVGRSPESALIIDYECISWQHCVILTYGREVIVRDEKSSNGTWVDGCRVRGQTAVQNGQTISFASVQARLAMPRQEPENSDTEQTAIYLHARAARAARKSAAAPKVAAPKIIKPRTEASAAPLAVQENAS